LPLALGKKVNHLNKLVKGKNKDNGAVKKSSPIDNEIIVVIFLMLIIVVVPIAISVWDIGTPIPGYS
jgi:hypothetical protein